MSSNFPIEDGRLDEAAFQKTHLSSAVPSLGTDTHFHPFPIEVEDVDVLTQRNNNARTGTYHHAGLNRSTFDKLRKWELRTKLKVEGAVYAQPLYMANIPIGPGDIKRNLVFIATAHNMVYAFDADTFEQIWTVWLGPYDRQEENFDLDENGKIQGCVPMSIVKVDPPEPPEPPKPITPNTSVKLGIGIQSTPVIDRVTQTLYVSYRTIDGNGNPHQWLQAMDTRTGRNKAEAEIKGEHFNVDFELVKLRQRASLLLLDGVIYVAMASRCEEKWGDYHGWIFAYEAQPLRPVGSFNTTPLRSGGGIWQASTGLAGDSDGSIYFITGNMTGENTPDRSGQNVANSFVRLKTTITRYPLTGKLGPSLGGSIKQVEMTVADWFTPYRARWQNDVDLDLGSAGVVLLPGTRYALGGGKEGIIYLLNRDAMGKYRAWSRWFSLTDPNKVPLYPAVVTNAAGGLDVFFLIDGVVWYISKASAMAPWGTSLQLGGSIKQFAFPQGGGMESGPAVGKSQDGRIEIFALGTDGHLWHLWQVSTATGLWINEWIIHEGTITDPPAVGQSADGRLEVFARGIDGSLMHKWQITPNGGWTNWVSRGGSIAGTPTVIAAPDGRLEVFARGGDGTLHHLREDGPNAGWSSPWIHHGGSIVGRPAVARTLDGRLEVFAWGRTNRLQHLWQLAPNGPWRTSWLEHQGIIGGMPAVARNDDGRLEVFAPGENRELLDKIQSEPNGVWDDWRSLGGQVSDPLAVGTNGDGRLELFATHEGKPGEEGLSFIWQPPMPKQQPYDKQPYDKQPFLPDDPNMDDVVYKFQAGFNTYHAPDSPDGPIMHDWGQWPHIHGTPVYAHFNNGTAILYIWAEKDYLRAWERVNHRFSPIAQSSQLAPDNGMPGGMLSLSIDPTQTGSGILFASVPLEAGANVWMQSSAGPKYSFNGSIIRGRLHAFDAMTLEELWNNDGVNYYFAKFCPPTIADGKVFLATFSNEVHVYGEMPRFKRGKASVVGTKK